MTHTVDLDIASNAPIPTWFGIGGNADRLVRARSVDDLRRCLEIDPDLRVLGEGANLLVADEGVGGLVVSTNEPEMRRFEIDETTGRVNAMAGAPLSRLVTDSVRSGLAGLEGIGGIPATIGGAAFMNAGGSFGQIADVVYHVHALTRGGDVVTLRRDEIDYGYRHSGLDGLLITRVELQLQPGDATGLRARLKDTMAYKKTSQPMASKSAGCVFRNPVLRAPIEDIGEAGERVGAGLLIDRAGCKGMSVGGARVSERHANFVVTEPGSRADDALALIEQVRDRVAEVFGVELRRELVVWRRS